MAVLKQAFNAITRIHSRAAFLKRLTTPALYSPIRITPSNYFRYLEGPSQTVIRGREFIIPVDSIIGIMTQFISFNDAPTDGSFTLSYGEDDTAPILFDAVDSDIEDALQAIEGLEGVTVEGDFEVGFLVTFYGVQSPLLLGSDLDMDFDAEITIVESSRVAFPEKPIKRGDKIIDTVFGSMAIDEVIEMVDIGGPIMGYRVRVE